MEKGQSYRSLLIVEDDKAALTNLDKFFTLMGYQVKTAVDGLAALKVLRDKGNNFHLLITDLVMPNISGVALITSVKKEFPDMKIIAVTGYGEQISDLALAAEAEAVFLKPLDLSKLENSVNNLLREYTPNTEKSFK
ncbi:MAG: response regulator [Proteobacteria bacterium]|nr:response regulator [Pseudomonadota bacterium]MBU1582970.1 response regulator [Pseudomonadota bacterium]MBU2452507.1 response regulator [Pseudomonadota bacterium]MBU2631763.1 response regulator [Pseudomonadota bacterium]